MPFKRTYNKDQKLLGNFVDGLPQHISPAVYETQPSKYSQTETMASRSQSYYVTRKEEDGEYSYNDMIGLAVPIVWSINGIRVLVCPDCKKDVEPVFPVPSKGTYHNEKTEVIFHDKSFSKIASISECLHCKIRYFIPELVAQKSFRLTLLNENVSSYYPYLTLDFFKGKWRVITADLVS